MSSGLRVVTASTVFAARLAADRSCRLAVEAGDRVVRLLPDTRQAALVQRRLADDGTPALGVDITTLDRWVADRWALFGDGRQPVDARMRRALVLKALDTTPVEALDARTLGIVGCVETVVRTASGLADFAAGAPKDAPLAREQLDALAVCETYRHLLDEQGLIEPGEAACLLIGAMDAIRWPHLVLDGVSTLSPAHAVLIGAACAHGGVTICSRTSPPDGPSNPANALADALVQTLAEACGRLDAPVKRLAIAPCEGKDAGRDQAGDTTGDPTDGPDGARDGGEASPWRSREIADLASTIFRPVPGKSCAPQGDVRFCLPAGRYAEPESIARIVADLVGSGIKPRDILICCPDPLAMQEAIAGRLALAGIQCLASGSVLGALTSAGRATLQLAELARAKRDAKGLPSPSPELRPVASDLARNRLFGIRAIDAQVADERWRSARVFGAAEYLDDLAQAAQCGDAFDAAANCDLAAVSQELRPLPHPGRETAAARLERNVADGMAALFSTAAQCGIDPLDHIERLVAGTTATCRRLSVPASSLAAQQQASVLGQNPDAVQICTMRDVEGRHAKALLICDLGADRYPLKDPRSAADGLLDALGVAPHPAHVDELRWQFFSAIETAGETLVLERPLHDENAGDLRPCALFEEVVDCYRDDVTDIDGLDKATGLPKGGGLALEEQIGEERVGEVVSPIGSALDRVEFTALRAAPMLARQASRGMLVDPAQPLSPSSIEDYLRCPYRWFWERRVPSRSIDAGFTGFEIGSFCHAVLHDVHERLREGAEPRITAELAADPRARMNVKLVIDECFDTQRRLHENVDEDVENRLVAIGDLEQRRMKEIHRDLEEAVWRDAWMPEGFNPRFHERSFGLGAGPAAVPYGGALLHGVIDRIDIDAAGRAIVVDYKGAMNDGYTVPDPEKDDNWPLPLHSQILMYASALTRMDANLTPVGCLYFSYSKPSIKGMLDHASVQLPPASLIDEDSLVQGPPGDPAPLGWLLDRVESIVADALANHLFAGDIEPNPRFGKKSCAYCRVSSCPRRVS